MNLLFLFIGAAVGWCAWGGTSNIAPLLFILVLPFIWGLTKTRVNAAALIGGYFLAGARGLPAGAVIFFGDATSPLLGWSMWCFSNALLTMPFVCLWHSEGGQKVWSFPIASVICALPPLAIIGWLNPVSVSGVMYPNLGLFGLLLTFGVMSALVARNIKLLALLLVVTFFANLGMSRSSPPPTGWRGVDTSFSRLSSDGIDDAGQLLASMRRVQWVANFVRSIQKGEVVVLPETIVGAFDGFASSSLRQAEVDLAARGARLLVGAEIPIADGRYDNALLVLGARHGEDRAAIQGIPVPVGMWKPWTESGAAAHFLTNKSEVDVNGIRAGVAICYEQVLAFSLLRIGLTRPDVLLAVSNIWWAKSTNIPLIQLQSVRAFSRLFGIPVIVARNS